MAIPFSFSDPNEARKFFAVIAKEYAEDVAKEQERTSMILGPIYYSVAWISFIAGACWSIPGLGLGEKLMCTSIGMSLSLCNVMVIIILKRWSKYRIETLLRHRDFALQLKDGQF
jgi:hypothetical protein